MAIRLPVDDEGSPLVDGDEFRVEDRLSRLSQCWATSTYFEREVEDGMRRFGHSKDQRSDRPQVVIGLAVTREGIPVRVWSARTCAAGNSGV